jgi:AAA domain
MQWKRVRRDGSRRNQAHRNGFPSRVPARRALWPSWRADGPREPGGYPTGFHTWPLERRNAWRIAGLWNARLGRVAARDEQKRMVHRRRACPVRRSNCSQTEGSQGEPRGQWAGRGAKAAAGESLVAKRASGVAPEAISWLWRNRFPHCRLSVLTGPPGFGKSQITAFLAAAVTTGRTWPDGSPCGVTGTVIVLSAEDDVADTIVPRLMAGRGFR